MIFSERCTYQGQTYWKVYGDGQPYRIQERWGIFDYLEKYYTATPEEFHRDVVGAGKTVSLYLSFKKISQETFQVFVKYLQDEYDGFLEMCREKIEKYKDDPEIRAIYERYGPACPLVYPAYWENGWHLLDYRREAQDEA